MPCKFHRERPWPFENLGPGCQFEGETDFFGFADKSWCRFHLPMEDDEGNRSEKADWGENEVTRFNASVLAFIDEARGDKKTADLTGVAFPVNVSFAGFTKDKPFPRVCFIKAAFSGNAYFREAAFSGNAYFCEAAFSRGANFGEAAFSRAANFDEAAFSGNAYFSKAAFSRAANFGEATFSGNANFREAAFSSDAYFSGAADFSGGADEEAPSRKFRIADFADVVFKGRADFFNRRFLDTARFTKTIFHVAPEFHNAELRQDTDFTGATFEDTSKEHAARAYRTLKLAMGNIGARNEEAMFYALEQKSLRDSMDKSLRNLMSNKGFVWLLTLLYERTADYGRSVVLPLGWLVGVTVVFWFCYALAAAAPGAAFDFAMAQLFRPFSVWIPLKAAGAPEAAVFATPPLLLKFLATLQSVISLGLLTLFILAVRRRFRLN
ncbi:MAG TPA: pentapeptide repeat-containing protein [Rhodospirillaceae bacterium]|nr:pentapeptide repeat-containing protein [Rhodospirillaceae bacterium]